MARKPAEVTSLIERTLSSLRSRIPIAKALLFGSYLEGKAHEYSDIDIAVFSPAVDAMSFQQKVDLIVEIERQIRDSIDLHLFGVTSLAEARPTNFVGYLLTHGKPIN